MICNIFLMGMTGVGKSSLLNYLAGEKLAEAGIPSGSGGLTRGIKKYNITIKNQECSVADSEGFENSPEHNEYWNQLISNTLFESRTSFQEWYPVVVYCIGSNGCRVQDADLDLMEEIMRFGSELVIAFTKADTAIDDDLESMKAVIRSRFPQIRYLNFVPLCSVKTRSYNESGKEELSNAIFKAWGTAVVKSLPRFLFRDAWNKVREGRNQVLKWIQTQRLEFNSDYFLAEINKRTNEDVNATVNIINQRKKELCEEMQSISPSIGCELSDKAIAQLTSRANAAVSNLQSGMDTTVEKSDEDSFSLRLWLIINKVSKKKEWPCRELYSKYGKIDGIISQQWDGMQRELDLLSTEYRPAVNKCDQKQHVEYACYTDDGNEWCIGEEERQRDVFYSGNYDNCDAFIQLLNDISDYIEQIGDVYGNDKFYSIDFDSRIHNIKGSIRSLEEFCGFSKVAQLRNKLKKTLNVLKLGKKLQEETKLYFNLDVSEISKCERKNRLSELESIHGKIAEYLSLGSNLCDYISSNLIQKEEEIKQTYIYESSKVLNECQNIYTPENFFQVNFDELLSEIEKSLKTLEEVVEYPEIEKQHKVLLKTQKKAKRGKQLQNVTKIYVDCDEIEVKDIESYLSLLRDLRSNLAGSCFNVDSNLTDYILEELKKRESEYTYLDLYNSLKTLDAHALTEKRNIFSIIISRDVKGFDVEQAQRDMKQVWSLVKAFNTAEKKKDIVKKYKAVQSVAKKAEAYSDYRFFDDIKTAFHKITLEYDDYMQRKRELDELTYEYEVKSMRLLKCLVGTGLCSILFVILLIIHLVNLSDGII